MKTITVLSKKDAKEFISEEPWACISINCPDDSQTNINKVKQMGYLHLVFWDADLPRTTLDPKFVFNKEMANKVWDFVEEVQDKIEVLMVHCLMGQSRSPAIAAAIGKVKHNDDQVFFDRHTPNMLVYRIMLDTAHERGLI